jgi:hypothetical protein
MMGGYHLTTIYADSNRPNTPTPKHATFSAPAAGISVPQRASKKYFENPRGGWVGGWVRGQKRTWDLANRVEKNPDFFPIFFKPRFWAFLGEGRSKTPFKKKKIGSK